MPKRPLLIKLVILFLALAPIGMISIIMYFDRHFYSDLGWQLNSQIYLFCVSSFAAAWGVYRSRSYGFWMFLVFVAACALVDLSDVIMHPEQRNLGHVFDLVFSVVGLAIIFRKKNRQLFFDKAMRWWERSTRFVVDWPTHISAGVGGSEARIQSISHSGCFLATAKDYPLATPLEIEVRLNDQMQKLKVVVVRISREPKGVGCTFVHVNEKAEQELKRVLKVMSKQTPNLSGQVA